MQVGIYPMTRVEVTAELQKRLAYFSAFECGEIVELEDRPYLHQLLSSGGCALVPARVRPKKLPLAICTTIYFGGNASELVEEFVWRLGAAQELHERYFDAGKVREDVQSPLREALRERYPNQQTKAALSVRWEPQPLREILTADNGRLLQTVVKSRQESVDLLWKMARYGALNCLRAQRSKWALTRADARSRYNQALRWAAARGHLAVIKELREWGLTLANARSVDNNALRCAASNGHLEVIKYFREWGLTLADARSGDNYALHCAAEYGQLAVIKYFRAWGLTLDDVRSADNNALIKAALYGHLSVIKELREWGLTLADVRTKDNDALCWAARNGHLAMIKYFREWGLTLDDARQASQRLGEHSLAALREEWPDL